MRQGINDIKMCLQVMVLLDEAHLLKPHKTALLARSLSADLKLPCSMLVCLGQVDQLPGRKNQYQYMRHKQKPGGVEIKRLLSHSPFLKLDAHQ